jgi:hypothetical protein
MTAPTPILIPSPVNGYSCPADPGEPGTGVPRLSISDEEGRVLIELTRGRSVVEFGTGLGVSTKYLAKKAQFVLTYDIDPWVATNIAPSLPAGVQFTDCLPFLNINGKFDCAFIDSLHTYEQCTVDIILARQLVKQGGLIIFHDLYIAGVRRAIEESGLPFIHIQTVAGMAFIWNDFPLDVNLPKISQLLQTAQTPQIPQSAQV